ncbi:hydroxymethylglutaryl-CoA lyase [Asanoa hainanensis]|uniref:hydroxymethylglutaryl-CoA lyase n=1 Tax=Asanoa hainanensis TaxID=560556 RepID=UPI001FE84696|nr:hydroxymethylglutaryl-CoA lyase [Asanoa hainanensis]
MDAAGSAVEIVEVGPRDGLQNERTLVSTAAKIAYIEALVAAGARRIEATSFVHPKRVPRMADAEEVMAGVPRGDGVRYIGLVVNERGLDRALAAGVDEVNVVVVATETFSQRNQGMSVLEGLRSFSSISARARSSGLRVTATVGASFGCPFEGEVDPAAVGALVRSCVDAGADEIALADTIGVGVPSDVARLVAEVRAVTTDLPLRFHFHNTRNTGYANALTAVALGASALDSSTGGIGGCPFAPAATGNIATEDLAYALRRSGVATGLDLAALVSAAALIGGELGIVLPALLGRAGDFPAGLSPERRL